MNDAILEIKVILDNVKALKDRLDVALNDANQTKIKVDAKIVEYDNKIASLQSREEDVIKSEKDLVKRESRVNNLDNFDDASAQLKGEREAFLKGRETIENNLAEREAVLVSKEKDLKNRDAELDSKAEKLAREKDTYKETVQKEMEEKLSTMIRG